VSIAMKREAGPQQAPRWNRTQGTPILEWRRNQIAYALIGHRERVPLQAISDYINTGGRN
jgi:hypothetical protein